MRRRATELDGGFETRRASWRGKGTADQNEHVPKVFSLAVGQHPLIVIGREAGCRIDKWIISPHGAPPAPDSGFYLRTGSTSPMFTQGPVLN